MVPITQEAMTLGICLAVFCQIINDAAMKNDSHMSGQMLPRIVDTATQTKKSHRERSKRNTSSVNCSRTRRAHETMDPQTKSQPGTGTQSWTITGTRMQAGAQAGTQTRTKKGTCQGDGRQWRQTDQDSRHSSNVDKQVVKAAVNIGCCTFSQEATSSNSGLPSSRQKAVHTADHSCHSSPLATKSRKKETSTAGWGLVEIHVKHEQMFEHVRALKLLVVAGPTTDHNHEEIFRTLLDPELLLYCY